MARSEDEVEKDLTPSCFRRCPVWSWTADNEAHTPVWQNTPLPEDRGDLFIWAKFTTPSGELFEGYIVGPDEPFAVCIFAGDHDFLFNRRLPKLAMETAKQLRSEIKDPKAILFPLRYDTKHAFEGQKEITGFFEFDVPV